ncbi:MAG: DNA gyrase inhibitor YacG [Proteobacteria bacterium]|nr:DNA gyrase inhibitor YacG [Pseudomonadota bacterium]
MSSAAKPPCPVCGKPAEKAFLPFCSPRCADIDLGRWLKGGYVIPGRPEDDADKGPAPSPGKDEPPES